MKRQVHPEALRERRNMRNASNPNKGGEWCVIGFCETWKDGLGVQGWGYKSESDAEDVANQLDGEEEFQAVKEHKVMTHSEFEKLCLEKNIDRNFPW